MFRPPGECPVCGEYVPAGKKSCPGCGSDERSGWSDDTLYDGLDLPDEAFAHDKFVEKEFGSKGRPDVRIVLWWIVGGILVGIIVWSLVIGH